MVVKTAWVTLWTVSREAQRQGAAEHIYEEHAGLRSVEAAALLDTIPSRQTRESKDTLETVAQLCGHRTPTEFLTEHVCMACNKKHVRSMCDCISHERPFRLRTGLP